MHGGERLIGPHLYAICGSPNKAGSTDWVPGGVPGAASAVATAAAQEKEGEAAPGHGWCSVCVCVCDWGEGGLSLRVNCIRLSRRHYVRASALSSIEIRVQFLVFRMAQGLRFLVAASEECKTHKEANRHRTNVRALVPMPPPGIPASISKNCRFCVKCHCRPEFTHSADERQLASCFAPLCGCVRVCSAAAAVDR